MNRKIEWLVTIVDRGRGSAVAQVYQKHQVAVQLITHGHGTASSKIMDILGLDEPEKTFSARCKASCTLHGPGQALRFRWHSPASARLRTAASHTAG